MPELHLPFWGHPILQRVSCFEVEAAMLFPSDEAMRRHYVLDRAIEWFMSEEDADTRRLIQDRVLLPADDDRSCLNQLLEHRGTTRNFDKKVAKAFDHGCVAGQIAVLLWLAPQEGILDSSVRKATDAIVKVGSASKEQWKEEKQREEQQPPPEPPTRNSKYVNEAWRSHKTVAHLWATLNVRSSSQSIAGANHKKPSVASFAESTFAVLFRDQLPDVLALAQGMHQALSEALSNSVEDPWIAPAGLELPTVLREEEERIDLGESVLILPKGGLITSNLPIEPHLRAALDLYRANPNRK